MEEKKICIICRKSKSKSEFNIEHIIPESIGNKNLIIDSVCKECNSELGKKVDCEITNNIISQLDRFINNIKGKSGKIPNPFRKGVTLDGRIVYCDDNLKPTLVPKVVFNKETGEYNILTSSMSEAIEIINKKFKRAGKSQLTNQQIKDLRDQAEIKKERPTIRMSTSVDLYKIQMEFIKIAYEFMYYLVGQDYLKDEQGKRLAKILSDYIYKDIKADYDGIIGELPEEEYMGIISYVKILGKKYFDNENIHYIQLSKVGNINIVNITLYSTFNYFVVVSNKNYNLYGNMYMINPINGGSVKD
ncbi:MAG: HNH endonuclease [Sporanaerobacter sp.]|jgi:hypothetical protein|uniref:HNH endonuclease n=1 Tax=Sporanaerobacter sp. TaxID=2010183 RepID=UPI003A0FEB38